MRKSRVGWILAAGMAVAGCTHSHGRAAVKTGPRGRIVSQMPSNHVHSTSCGHFLYDGDWYEVPGHLHGPACGHVLEGKDWVWRAD